MIGGRSNLPAARAGVGDGLRAPVAVVGAGGMLGRAFRELLAAKGIEHRGFLRAELDVTSPASVEQLAGFRVVINCAAWTDVDGAEANEAAATTLNAEAVGVLAERCIRSGAVLVHFGTDYVFSGNATSPYPLDAPIAPLNAYGRSKAAGEAVLEVAIGRGLKTLHARTSWLYAPWGKNFVRTIAAASATKPQLKVVNDQRGRPTSCLHLARSTVRLLELGAQGVTHITDGGECTWFEFAGEIVRVLGRACQVAPCTTAEFPRPAVRPMYSVLSLENLIGLNGDPTSWRTNLSEVLGLLEA